MMLRFNKGHMPKNGWRWSLPQDCNGLWVCQFVKFAHHSGTSTVAKKGEAERVTGNRIINLHVDGGGEFMTTEFRTHCRNRGIKICATQDYSPEMNGIAENKKAGCGASRSIHYTLLNRMPAWTTGID